MTVSKIAQWDKFKSWTDVKLQIQEKLKSDDRCEEAITIDVGPQLLYMLRHPSALRCMEHTGSHLGDAFTCHYNKGATQGVRVWLIPTKEKNGVCKNVGFETDYEITSLSYVAKHRVYLVFSTDLVLRVFTDAHSNFVEVHSLPCLTTTLCLIYNKEEDVVYAGGIGFMEEWRIQGAEHAACLVPGREFHTDLTRNDWVRDIKIVKQNNIIIGQHGNGLCVVHTKTGKQMYRLPNRHDGPLKCCCYYRPSDFLITGGADGKIKFYNGTAFNLLHVIIGHNGPVTDLAPHSKDTLLFSSSLDGTIRIWSLDTQQLFMRLDIGEKIYHMALLGDTEFYFQTEKNVVVYNLNQFYEFFAGVASETMRLLCCKGKGRPNKILGSAEDGSVRLMSPVTGLTLTIIYPMPSFQVLSSFAYDLHQDRLHTVLTDGKVIVYNTSTNPCKGEEIWNPISEDEHVNIILLITLEFPGEEGTDIDNLVFGGLENGQIILCDSVVCTLDMPLQAHEGAIVCLERCHRGKASSSGFLESQIISGGTDKFVKIWKIVTVDIESRKSVLELLPLLKIYLLSVPEHVCMYSTLLWVAVPSNYYKGKRWRLILYDMVDLCDTEKRSSQSPLQLSHPEDEDHYQELTSLNRCSMMNVVMTSGKDGFVKIWSSRNELLREMNFATPIYASCFANEHGDILVGYGTHICSVSVVTYLPLEYLKQVFEGGFLDIKDDIREPPVKFDHISQPWLDITKLKQYSVDLGERRQQRLEEEVIEKLKKSFEKETPAKFVIFVDGNTTKVIRKDFADKLLTWAKGKIKLKITKPAEFNPFSDIDEDLRRKSEAHTEELQEEEDDKRQKGEDNSSLNEDNIYLDKQGFIQLYPSSVGKALKALESLRKLGPIEMKLMKQKELMKRDPIIAPDGFIPNSVIRGRIKPKKYAHEIPVKKAEKPFQLKPVPKVNPHHMPSWWGKEEDVETSVSTLEYRVTKWEDTPSPSPRSEVSAASSVSLKSLIESPVKKYIAEGRGKATSPKTAKLKSSPKLARLSVAKNRSDLTPVDGVKHNVKVNDRNSVKQKSDWGEVTPESESRRSQYKGYEMLDFGRSDTNLSETSGPSKLTPKFKPVTPTMYKLKSKRIEMNRFDLEMGTPDSMRRGRRSGAREKSFKLTNYAVDEDSSAIRPKETKSGRRTRGQGIIKQLMEESWMPEFDGECDDDEVFSKLISVLDNDNPAIYDSVCRYITDIFSELGLSDNLLDDALGKLGAHLKHPNTAIKKYSIKTMQALGQGRPDVLPLILPKLVDPEEQIRKAAAKAVQLLTGATSKESLMSVLEEMGITSGWYNSKEDEELALAALAERFAEQEDPVLLDRIQNWVEGTTPGLFDEDREDDFPSWSRKETSFMSEGGKSANDLYDTSRMNTELPATPGSLSDNSELAFSREVSMNDPKSAGAKSAKNHYNARLDLLNRGGASNVPGEREDQFTPPTPLSDIVNGLPLRGQSGFMDDPLANFEDDPLINYEPDPLLSLAEEPLPRETSNLTGKSSQNALDNILLNERTLTDLSQVGPLPNFMHRDNSGRNGDDVSTDSAFESAISVSEYATSHFSEKWTISHIDQQSSKHSQVSEENNMFDVEQVSTLEYEGDDLESGIDLESMSAHENNTCMKFTQNALRSEHLLPSNDIDFVGLETINSMLSDVSEELESGKISVIITPRTGRESMNSKKESPVTPRSRGPGFKKKLPDIDGFSTVSERSNSSRQSRGSGSSRSERGFKGISERLGSSGRSTVTSRNSSDPSIPVPYGTSSLGSRDTPVIEKEPLKRASAYSKTGRSVTEMPGTSGINSKQVRKKSLRKERAMPGMANKKHALLGSTERSTLASRSSSEPGIPLPFTSTMGSQDAPVNPLRKQRTSKFSKKEKSIKETPEESGDNSKQVKHKSVTKAQTKSQDTKKEHATEREKSKGSVKGKVAKGTNPLDKKEKNDLKLSEKKAKSSAVHGVAETTEVPKATQTASEETPANLTNTVNANGMLSLIQDAPVIGDNHNVAMATIDEESIVILKTSGNVNTTNGYTDNTGDDKNDMSIGSFMRSESVQEMNSPEHPALDIRFTPRDPKLYKYYDNLHQDEASKKHTFKETEEEIGQKDSDYRTMSDITNSQINDRLSGYDSGIAHDISEYSNGRMYRKDHGVALSPVKSVPTSPSPKSPQDWRKFFDMVPNAHERRQMEQIRKEMEEGKLRHSTLPPITYFAEDLPMLPGEAGTRLLQTVRVGEKRQLPGDGRHRIESVPGKLQVHTQNEDAGLSNFGILQMQWTTGVPTVKDRLHPPQRIPQYRTQRMIRLDESMINSSLHGRQQMVSEDEELRLPYIGSNTPSVLSSRTTNHYEWEYPLPPPPAKESRTSIPHIRKDHDSYCKYYNLIKKKLHLYTSNLGFIPAYISAEKARPKQKQQREKTRTLPEVFVKRLREPDSSGSHMTRSHDRMKRKRTLTKTDMKSSLMFPPIKLGQLVKIF